MENINELEIFVELEKEFSVDDDGIGYCSQGGLARMCGVTQQAMSKFLKKLEQGNHNQNTPEILKTYARQGFKLTTTNYEIPDYIASQIIKVYAKRNKVANQFLDAFLAIGLRRVIQKVTKWTDTKPVTEAINITVKDTCEVLDLIFKGVHIEPALVAGVKINAVSKINPQLGAVVSEVSQPLLAESTAKRQKLLTPTDIGKELGLSAIKVNQRLIEFGLQVKNENKKSRKEPSYIPTELGQEYCTYTLSTGSKNDSTSYQQLRWYDSVINTIED